MRRVTAVLLMTLAASAAVAQMKAPKDTVKVTKGTATLQPVKPRPISSARRIGRQEAQKLAQQGKAVFVDVRSRESYDREHIKGAVSIPMSQLRYRFSELPPGRLLITYCA